MTSIIVAAITGLFLLRSKGYTLDTISEKLIISRDWAGKLSQKVNKKIIRSL